MAKRPPGPGRGRKIKQGTGVSSGDGWGGTANGPGIGGPAIRPKVGGHKKAAAPKPPRPRRPKSVSALIKRGKEENAKRMKAIWLSVAEDKDAPHMARVVAAEKWLNREFGMPVQKNENEDTVKVVVTREDRQKRIKALVAKSGLTEDDSATTH